MLTIEVKGVEEAMKKINKFSEKIVDTVDDSLYRAANEIIVPKAMTYAPVQTGRLRSSIFAIKTGWLQTKVGSDVDYAVHQEFGFFYSIEFAIRARWGKGMMELIGQFSPGKFFLTRAVNESIIDVREYIINEIKRKIGG